MTYSFTIALDTTLQPGLIYVSNTFTNPRFLIIDVVNLPDTEALEVGMSFNVILPIIGKTVRKNYPIMSENIVGLGDTFYVIPVPIELGDSQYSMELVVGFPENLTPTSIRVYVYSTDTTLNTISEDIEEVLSKLDTITQRQILDLAEDSAQVVNSVQNNIAFSILATSLAPITAGTSLGAAPPLGIGTGALAGLLLPGL